MALIPLLPIQGPNFPSYYYGQKKKAGVSFSKRTKNCVLSFVRKKLENTKLYLSICTVALPLHCILSE